jgi:sialate O-acetylesterase
VIGERLSYLALLRDYKIKGVPADAPTYKSVEIKNGKAILSFNNMAVPNDQQDPRSFSWLDEDFKVIALKGFEIAGSDRKFYPAKARLLWSENQIEVCADEVSEPIAVRYAFKNFSDANIKTTFGQPLAPFRTDDWEILPDELFK